MPRYTVTVIAADNAFKATTLLVPLQADSIVSSLVDEIVTRCGRQKLPVTSTTHKISLHLTKEDGALIDQEDVLNDIVLEPQSEVIFAVCSLNPATGGDADRLPVRSPQVTSASTQNTRITRDSVQVRVMTPATAKQNRESLEPFAISASATIRELHERCAQHLELPASFEKASLVNECNCNFARKLAGTASSLEEVIVIYNKSSAERVKLPRQTKAAIDHALQQQFGVDLESRKKITLLGGQLDDSGQYIIMPTVAICSKERHIPAHARATELPEESYAQRSHVLDLHTAEMPIHTAAMDVTIKMSGLLQMSNNGVLNLFAVHRATSEGVAQSITGKDAIFRDRVFWQPPVRQSDRGMAMFLSTLRVASSLLQEMDKEPAARDAALHVFDLLSGFPPALRTFYLLSQGKTPTQAECAALSHTIFQILEDFMPTDLIGTRRDRLFEGARLLFGSMAEKARGIRLESSPSSSDTDFPYLAAMTEIELRDVETNEPIMYVVQTQHGPVERDYFDAFMIGGTLFQSRAQPSLVKGEADADKAAFALLSGGISQAMTIFNAETLARNYRYEDHGEVRNVIDEAELKDLHFLAELCGRNKLAVHKPRQLASAVDPCLTFDRNAHLAVYLGEQPCGTPGQSSLTFRPQHGTQSIDTSIVEQLIAPILKEYEANGTAVFCTSGGAAVRKLESPCEILMFCVDTSASMRQATDFSEVNEDTDAVATTTHEPVIEGSFFTKTTFEEMKELLTKYEGFDDMVAIVADAAVHIRKMTCSSVLAILRRILSTQLVLKTGELERMRNRGRYTTRTTIADKDAEISRLKTFSAGLQTHAEHLCHFLTYRAVSMPKPPRWTWSLGDTAPSSESVVNRIPSLPSSLTEIPDELRCPISHGLMEDAATATDGHTYSRQALMQWFAIRKASPLHGTPLEDTSMTDNEAIADAAAEWAAGKGIIDTETSDRPSKKQRSMSSPEAMSLTFDSTVGGFERCVPNNLSVHDLYRLVYRALEGRHNVFQLVAANGNRAISVYTQSISSLRLKDGDKITIRIADDGDLSSGGPSNSVMQSQKVLVKVFCDHQTLVVGYWVDRHCTSTLTSVLWKYWRTIFSGNPYQTPRDLQVWSNMSDDGDGMACGTPHGDSTSRLSSLLGYDSCFGHLGTENVYRDKTFRVDYNKPMVLKVNLSAPYQSSRRSRLSRLDVLKQMFEALINRLHAYSFKTHVGLINIASDPTLTMPLSHVVENFRRATNDLSAQGDTALWDSLALAKDQLVEYGAKYPEAKKRVIIISDGSDTSSKSNTAEAVAWDMFQSGIAVDSISLGDEDNAELRAVSSILSCYKFEPVSLVNALAICEMEPFLSVTERPDIVVPASVPRYRSGFKDFFFYNAMYAGTTQANATNFPARKAHPNISDSFILLADAARILNAPAPSSSTGARSNFRVNRLMNEMRQMVATGPRPAYDVYVSESDISFWKVVMQGPSDTPYAGGNFLLYVHAEDRYPAFAPKARFVTRIKHPNISLHGRICHSILDRDWTTDTSMSRLLDTFYGLLFQAELSDPVNTTITLGYHHDQVEFADEVRESVRKYASKTREQWKTELLEGGNWEDEDAGDSVENDSDGTGEGDEDDEMDD